MAKKNFKFKLSKKLKSIICATLVVAVSVACIGGIAAFAKRDTKSISSTAFAVGGLDENGKYLETSQSIYTKNAFECKGLRITPDFDATLTYDVYLYDSDNELLEAKTGLTDVFKDVTPLAKTARVVIHPEIPSDVKEKDFKIRFYQIYGYANDLDITVDKDQTFYLTGNLYNENKVTSGKTFNPTIGTAVTLTENASTKVTEKILVSDDWNMVDVYIKNTEDTDVQTCAVFCESDDKIITRSILNYNSSDLGEWVRITIEIPVNPEADYLMVKLPSTAECCIFGYND